MLVLWFCARVHSVWLHARVRAARLCARAGVLSGSVRGLAGCLVSCSYAGCLVLCACVGCFGSLCAGRLFLFAL